MFNHVDHGIVLPKLTRKTTPNGRKYFTPEGNAYPSITTVLGILSKDAIIAWRNRVGEAEANKISNQASTRGTAVHQLAEDYVDNAPDWSKGHMPANIHTFNQLRPILDKHLDNIWMQEAFLYSDRLRCAGQVDCIGEWDGELTIIDYKTSKRPKKEEYVLGYFIQASFYAAAFYERTGIPIKKAVIAIAVDGDDPQIWKINTFDYLQHYLNVRKKYDDLGKV